MVYHRPYLSPTNLQSDEIFLLAWANHELFHRRYLQQFDGFDKLIYGHWVTWRTHHTNNIPRSFPLFPSIRRFIPTLLLPHRKSETRSRITIHLTRLSSIDHTLYRLLSLFILKTCHPKPLADFEKSEVSINIISQCHSYELEDSSTETAIRKHQEFLQIPHLSTSANLSRPTLFPMK